MIEPLTMRVHWTNEAQRKAAIDLFGFYQVRETRTFYVADDVARRLQANAVKASGKTVGELLALHDGISVKRAPTFPDGAIVCVIERAGAAPVIEKVVWPTDRRLPSVSELKASP